MRYIVFLFTLLILSGCNNGDQGLLGEPGVLPEKVTELNISPKVSKTPVGFSMSYKAEALLSNKLSYDVTNEEYITWHSSNNEVAVVNHKGIVTTVSEGDVIITATGIADDQTFSASAELEVTGAVVESLVITPKVGEIPVGLKHPFVATAYLSDGSALDVTKDENISWSSDNNAVASVSNTGETKGSAKGLAVGTAIITATGVANGQTFSASAELQVTDAVVKSLVLTPKVSEIPVGLKHPFIATAYLSDGSALDVTKDEAISWSSDNSAVASVSNTEETKGSAKGLAVGKATITATGVANGQTFSASAELEVTGAVVESLVVTPKVSESPVGLKHPFIATAYLSDGSALDVTKDEAISWSSDNNEVASVSNTDETKGSAKGLAVGTAIITATGVVNGQTFSASAELEVTGAVVESLVVTPKVSESPVGLKHPFIATAYLSDGSALDVTKDEAISWSSDNDGATSVSNTEETKGDVEGLAVGKAIITATGVANGQTFSASAELQVTDAVVMELQVSPVERLLPVGIEKEFIATLVFSDGSELNVTDDPSIHWKSENSDVATVTTGYISGNGIVKGISIGSSVIAVSGKFDDVLFSASANVGITEDKLHALYIDGAASIPVYNYLGPITEHYKVYAEYSDIGTVEYVGSLDWEVDISVSGLATFDPVSYSITTNPMAPEIAGKVTLTACVKDGVTCVSKEVILFTQIIQVLEDDVGGESRSCEDLGYKSINEAAFIEIFNSEFRPADVSSWDSTSQYWSYGLTADIFGRILPRTASGPVKRAVYIEDGATSPSTGREFITDTYDLISSSFGRANLICSID
ncbi:Ig-like domain-containing protein [Vibrio hyugaensis]|uniref:Ig-like domain-containing protein n=1 Tax=Vibrio hyugaensis TaxID=1534743 RepID=UPI0009E2F24F|nr:Ig-like domain-containing protein [Vibrio hyugaensis]